MRCKKCEYRLWNLTSRLCPECGTPFRPSEFEHVINSVQFCCPHCNQAYYGTGAKGHLEPVEFECVSCRRHVHMDDMVLLPTEGIEEEQTHVDVNPWLERKKRGFFRAWFSTIGKAMTAPGRQIQATPLDSSIAAAFSYATLTNSLFLLCGAGLFLIAIFIPTVASGARSGAIPIMMAMVAVVCLGVMLGVMIAVAAGGALVHGLLRVTGKTESTIGRTYHAVCYSSGANVLTAIPCFGFWFGWIWWAVSAVLMVKAGQKVHGARATLAVLLPAILILGSLVGSVGWATGRLGRIARTSASSIVSRSCSTMTTALLDYVAENENGFPTHAIHLVEQLLVDPINLVLTGSLTQERDVPIGDTTLDQFDLLSPSRQRKLAQACADALPKNTIAHRLGDFVFTYHGIDPANADPQLWVVIMSPQPSVNPSPSVGGFVAVGLLDGSTMQIPIEMLAARLAEQNALRRRNHLPPLPDPATVTHAEPAVTPSSAPDATTHDPLP